MSLKYNSNPGLCQFIIAARRGIQGWRQGKRGRFFVSSVEETKNRPLSPNFFPKNFLDKYDFL